MPNFTMKLLALVLLVILAIQANASNSTGLVEINEVAKSPMISPTMPATKGTAENSQGPVRGIIAAMAENPTTLNTPNHLNITINCGGAAVEASSDHIARAPKKGGHKSHGNGNEEESSYCKDSEDDSEHLSTAMIAAIIVSCVLGAVVLSVATVAVIITMRRRRERLDPGTP
ncbi:hypothetical protein SLS62_010934 [Diatrype stigma]|uniref:Uncharacterized protein n=1 Tax=Diatrype stigma TaxID=117547 RepID=A0AAN9U6T5_9PEZI